MFGKNINFRLVEVDDASFILSLRLDSEKGRHLSIVNSNLDQQRDWIEKYKKREALSNEYYYIIVDTQSREDIGVVRLYDFRGESFCWGSWILKSDAPTFAAVESLLLVYELAFFGLGFLKTHFDVRKENKSVVHFHQKFGSKIVDEDQLNYYFEFSMNDYLAIRNKYKRFLPV